MIPSDAKSLHSYPLKDFSGGCNTDTPGTDKELLQCVNAVLDPKGFPELRGGSKILNVNAPIGYQEKEVWGYLLSSAQDLSEYTASFLTGGAIAASAYSADADHVVDGLPATNWQAKDLYAWSTSYDSNKTSIYSLCFGLGKLLAGSYGEGAKIFSYNGTSWSTAYSEESLEYGFRSIIIHNGKFIAAGGYGAGRVYSSTDGVTWAYVGGMACNNIESLCSHNGVLWAATAMNGAKIYSSINDGVTWTLACTPNPAPYSSTALISFNGDLYFSCHETSGSYRAWIYKFNGISWAIVYTNAGSMSIYASYVWKGQLYFGANGGRLLISPDGTNWALTADVTGGGSNRVFVEYNTKLLVASNNKIYETSNGTDWTLFYDSVEAGIYSMVVFKWTIFSDDSLYVGTGSAGKVLVYENTVSYADQSLIYTLATPKTARKMAITPYVSGVRLFTLYGSVAGVNYTSIYSSVCDAGSTRQEFIFANDIAYTYYKLMIHTAHEDYFIGVNEWELMELSTSVDLNYYIFNKTAKDIIRKVEFPTLGSMLNFITYWKAKNIGWAATYYCTASDFDINDNGDVSTKIIAEGEFTIDNFSEAILDSKINEWVSVFSLLMFEENNEMFGDPQAWKITLGIAGVTSMHELKRRDLKRTYSYDPLTGIFSNVAFSPEQYVQNKFIFVTADNALLTANYDSDLSIHGFNVLTTGLKLGTIPSWVNFQNRAFMANGDESDADLKWTDGEVVHRVGLVAPIEAPTLSANAATGGHLTDGTYFYKYAYHRTTYGTNDGNPSAELEVTLSGGLGSINSSTFFGGTGYAVGQILTAVYSGASGATFRIDTVDSAGKALSITQLTDGVKYAIANSLATTVDVAGGTGATISVLSIVDLDKTQMTTLVVKPSSDPQVDKIYLYRTKLNDYIFYKCAEITNVYDANNAELTLTINSVENDNSLGVANLLDTDNDLPPNSKYLESGGNRMWYVTNSGVYFSKKGSPEKVPIENWIPVNEDDGEKVMGAKVVGTWLVIGKETRMFSIDINNPENLQAICIADTVGLVDNKTFRAISDQALIWYSQLGLCLTDGMSVVIVSKGKEGADGVVIGKIFNDLVDNFDSARKNETFGIYYPKRQQYWCHVPYVGLDANGLPNYRIWVFDLQKRSFFKFQFPIEPKDFYLLTDSDNNQKLISTFTQVEAAKYYGYFVIYDDDADYHDTSSITLALVEGRQDIAMQIITCWNCFGLAERIKSFRMIYTEMYAAAAVSPYISCGIDYKRMEYVQIPLTGSINTTASVSVVGVGTYFLTELVVGNSLVVGTETRVVATITDNTHLTVTVAFSDMANDASIFKLAPGVHRVQIVHPGEVGTAPTAGRDEIEGYDYGRTRSIPSPVDGVGTYFSIRFECTGHVKIKLFGFTIMFRLRGARP